MEQKYAAGFSGKGNHVFCILTDKEPVRTFACRQLTSKSGKPYERVYDCRKPVKQYYIYLHDALLGGLCYLKISSYLPFHSEFYFNGHNAIQLQLDKQGIRYRLKDNAFVEVEDPEALQKAAESLDGRAVLNRINYWMNIFFKFDKGKYSTRSRFLEHGWYLSQIEISSNVVFRSPRFCTSLFERLLDKFHRLDCPRPLPKFSAVGSIADPHPRPSGDCMTIMRASSTGSEGTPSNSTTRPGITSGPRPPSTTPNRWGFKNLSFFYRPIFGKVSHAMIGF